MQSDLAQRTALALRASPQVRLLGMGTASPAEAASYATLQTPPLRGYELAEWLRTWQVDTVIHLDISGEEAWTHHGEASIQHNILGTIELLGACANAGVRRVVLRSSSLIYGADPTNPAFLHEQRRLAPQRLRGLLRNYGEIETFVAQFAPAHPNCEVVLLRCAPLVGAGVWSPLSHYLSSTGPRMLLGFNPRIQVLHPDDAGAAFALAACNASAPVYNIAADHPLTLAQAVRLAGQQPVGLPLPLVGLARRLGLGQTTMQGWPFPRSFLQYSCTVDTRLARHTLMWHPQHQAADILRALADYQSSGGVSRHPNYSAHSP